MPSPTPPYTLREALHGTAHLEQNTPSPPSYPPHIRSRLLLFSPILDRPKQALHHLLELFLLHICLHPNPPNPTYHQTLLHHLAALSQHLIPPVQPITHHAKESYPAIPIPADTILSILRDFLPAFPAPFPPPVPTALPGEQPNPAKSAILAYAAFLDSQNLPTAWLAPYLMPNVPGRRERPSRHHPTTKPRQKPPLPPPLHTLFTLPYLNRHTHLIWLTVRTAATPSDIIALPATSYARGNAVTIRSETDPALAARVDATQIVNVRRLDSRLWETWTGGACAAGRFASLAPRRVLGRVVRFDRPVRGDDALAAGWAFKQGGVAVRPDGKTVRVGRRADGLFEVGGGGRWVGPWPVGMKFA